MTIEPPVKGCETRAVPLDGPDARPKWTDEYLSRFQSDDLIDRTAWVVLLDQADLSHHAHHVGLRLQLHTGGSHQNKAWPGVRSLAERCKLSKTVVRSALDELEGAGWIVKERRTFAKNPKHFQSNRYHLAWPVDGRAMPAPATGEGLCWELTTAGERCTRQAGWGTASDRGPCVFHGGERKNDLGHDMTHPGSRHDPPPGPSDDPPRVTRRPTLGHDMTPSSVVSSAVSTMNVPQPSANASAEKQADGAKSSEQLFIEECRASGVDEVSIRRVLAERRKASA